MFYVAVLGRLTINMFRHPGDVTQDYIEMTTLSHLRIEVAGVAGVAGFVDAPSLLLILSVICFVDQSSTSYFIVRKNTRQSKWTTQPDSGQGIMSSIPRTFIVSLCR